MRCYKFLYPNTLRVTSDLKYTTEKKIIRHKTIISTYFSGVVQSHSFTIFVTQRTIYPNGNPNTKI